MQQLVVQNETLNSIRTAATLTHEMHSVYE